MTQPPAVPTPPAAPAAPPAPVLQPEPVPPAPVDVPDDENVKGGLWQLLHQKFTKVLSKPREPYAFKEYKRGDIVELDDEQADRLVRLGAFGKPGEAEQAEADRLMAAAEAADAAAKAAKDRADAAKAAQQAAASKTPGK